jgi:hypothetical protein
MHTKLQSVILKKRDNLADLGMDVRMLTKWILKKSGVGVGLDLYDSG